MSAGTEPSVSANPEVDGASSSAAIPRRKPHLALFVATVCGLGYSPVAPGTFGSLAGALIALLATWAFSVRGLRMVGMERAVNLWTIGLVPGYGTYVLAVLVAAVGVWAATAAARYKAQKDPQSVVIDEVSGQLVAYFLPFIVLNWKSWLLGFILFRVFDIWKPFPARQAESLPGGWGIMADDWIAGIYAGIGLWIARAAGL